MNELCKAEIEPRPGGSVEAPDPSELIDLEARYKLCIVYLLCICVFVVPLGVIRNRSERDKY